MTILAEVIAYAKELMKTNTLVDSISCHIPIADYYRNRFIIFAKHAIRHVLNEHKPYAKWRELPYLSSLISSAIMSIATKPELFDYYERLIEEKFIEIKHATHANNLAILGMGATQKLLTYGLG